jgi:hypothetical protein
MAKKTRTQVMRLTKQEYLEARDMTLRGECLATATMFSREGASRSVQDTLRCADQIFSWIKSRELPKEAAELTVVEGGK